MIIIVILCTSYLCVSRCGLVVVPKDTMFLVFYIIKKKISACGAHLTCTVRLLNECLNYDERKPSTHPPQRHPKTLLGKLETTLPSKRT